jgi:2TM domain
MHVNQLKAIMNGESSPQLAWPPPSEGKRWHQIRDHRRRYTNHAAELFRYRPELHVADDPVAPYELQQGYVNIGLFVINALTSGLAGGVWWFYWPLIGWGLGLGAHALGVFGFGGGGPWGRDWEERKTREMMDKQGGLYHASHRIGTSFRAVAPSSHGSQVLR